MNLQKSYFMLKKLVRDWHPDSAPFAVCADNASSRLGYYYFVFEEDFHKLNRLMKVSDAQGIPLNTTYVDVAHPTLHYYPISIGQYGLAVFHSWLTTGDSAKREHFLRIAAWFMEHAKTDARLGAFWLTEIPKPEYRVDQPWKSAFTQSRALSVLLRAWQLTGEPRYLKIASLALNPFGFDISAGGVTAHLMAGKPFYEEYVAAEPTMVLDGHNFALFGLYDFVRAVPRDQFPVEVQLATELFFNGIESLLHYLPDFDLGYWVRFNLCRMTHYPAVDPCTLNYLKLVVAQLRILAELGARKELLEWADKFARYLKPVNIMRMYMLKYQALKQLKRL